MKVKKNNLLACNWVLKASLLTVLCYCLCACHRDKFEDLEQYVAQLKQTETKQQTVPPLKLNTPKAVAYQSGTMRSPFVKPGAIAAAATKGTSANPLQAYPLSMLRLAGTVSEGAEVKAYLITPENMLYQVKVGDIIGDQNGKVTEILPDRLNVMEMETSKGKPGVQRIVTLQLKGMP